MDFWLCDLNEALKCINENYGHLGIVAESVVPSISGNGIVFNTTSGVICWDKHTNKII